jgi:hypothetical protein
LKIYHYNEQGLFIKEGTATRSPLDAKEVYLIPARATDIAPPSCKPGTIARFSDGSWDIIIDKRGTKFWDKDTGQEFVVIEVGINVPQGSALTPPPPTIVKPKWDGSSWIETFIPPPLPGLAKGFKEMAKLKDDLVKAKDITELKVILEKVLFTGEASGT